IWFGTGTPNTTTYSPISTATVGVGAIDGIASACGRHLNARTTAPCGEIMALTSGTPGSQIFTIQYKNYKTSSLTATSVILNFQIRLYEGTNIIEYNYGKFTTTGLTTNTSCQVGLRGASNTDFVNRTSTTTWDTTTAGTVANASIRLNPTVFADSGLIFQWTPPPVCSGTPTAGTTLIANDTLCVGSVAHLSLSGVTVASGITYQWQSSTDGTTWTSIPGATNNTLTDTITGPVYLNCAVYCSNGTPAFSSTVQIFIKPWNQCYCTPASSNTTCISGGYIDSVAIASSNFKNVSACDQLTGTAYSDYPVSANTTDTLLLDSTYTLYVRTTAVNKISLWIDYNHSGTFETNEWTQIDTASVANVASFKNFTIPPTALTGTTKMRIRSRTNTASNTSTDPCTQFGSGETEDYTVYIKVGSSSGIFNYDKLNVKMDVFPNPFVNDVTISYVLKSDAHNSELGIYNVYGQLIRMLYSGKQSAGSYSYHYNNSDLADGIYLIKCTVDGKVASK
ncbi:MAG TPA: GEVED domain-containing protein, partial [Bacteroidia bacterium]